jgi:hypothetical protein
MEGKLLRSVRNVSRVRVAVALLGATMASAPLGASAQRPADKASAEALFDDARRLLAAGKLAEACPKFAESQRLDPAIGTLLNLGDCYERSGKLASAWAAFREAAAASRNAGDARREAEGQKRAAALEMRIPKLTVSVPPEAEVAGLEVKRDGVSLGKAVWASPTPVDPGEHVVEATAPGKQRWSKTVVVEARPTTLLVTVPRLQDAAPGAPPPAAAAPATVVIPPPAGPPAAAQPIEDGGWGAQRYVGVAAIGVGLAGIGVGTVFGLRARAQNDDSAEHCSGNTCTAAGVALRDDALESATVSTAAFGAAAALLVGGTVLFATAPSKTSVGVSAGPRLAGLRVERVW